MNLKHLTDKVLSLSLVFFLLLLGSFSVLAASNKVLIDRAKTLHQHAIELHTLGNHVESVRVAKQALNTLKSAYKSKTNTESLDQFSTQLKKFEEDPERAVPLYLKCLETFLSRKNLRRFKEAEKKSSSENYSSRSKKRFRFREIEALLTEKEAENAQKLHKQAKSLYEKGDWDGTIKVAQQALKIYEPLRKFRNAHSHVQSTTKIATHYIAIGDMAKAAANYLLCLRIYENETESLAVYDRRTSSDEKAIRQETHVFAEKHARDILLGKLDRETLKKMAKAMVKKDIPKYQAREFEKVSGFTGLLYEYIEPERGYEKAFSSLLNILAGDKTLIQNVINFIPEKEKLDFLTKKRNNLNAFLSLVLTKPDLDPESRKKAFDIWITRKGLLLEAQRQFQQALIDSGDKEAVTAFQQLDRIRAQISNLMFSDLAKDETSKQLLAELEKQKSALEDKLSRMSQAYASQKEVEKADTTKIAQLIPKGTVLIDFARMKLRDFSGKKWLSAHYMVFVLHAGKDKNPIIIDLGEADRIDKTITRFKRQIEDESDIRNRGKRLKKTSKRLYSLVFFPIIDALAGVKRIYISPDSNLNLIPFEVLQDRDGRYLIEQYSFDYLAASRDILRFGRNAGQSGQSVIIGNPDFDMAGGNNTLEKHGEGSTGERGISTRSGDMSGMRFDPLPHTLEEVNALQSVSFFKNAAVYKNESASEAALFSHKAPKILHLATHGFFLNDQDLDALSGTDLQQTKEHSETQSEEIKIYDNPLLRSGIALAGANATLKSYALKSQGIVTSEKILGLNLQGTQMVVLSACQTGIGTVKAGEGVFGLRRAFLQAGTKSLVMSMWKVPDKETCELMVQFYENIDTGISHSRALRQAALRQKQIAEERYGFAHPVFWGAFVFLGEL